MSRINNKKTLQEAMKSGCTTVAELALYLKIQTSLKTA